MEKIIFNFMHSILPEVRGKYRFDVDLSKLCWFGVGGKASVVFTPADQGDLVKFLKEVHNRKIFVFGVGSNTLIRDGGFDGIVIRLGSSMNYVKLVGECIIEAGCTSLDANVAAFALENEIGGMEFLSGIPGTVGGGLAMNGGAYGKEFSDVVKNVKGVNLRGNIIELSNNEMRFKYRGNGLKDVIFLSAELKGYQSSREAVNKIMNEIKTQREASQPVKGFKTGGSTFKNPPDMKAWKLIDEAGCRGLRVGGAQMSELHCNFLINTGNATAADIEDLIKLVIEKVINKSGVKLEPEIVFIGNR